MINKDWEVKGNYFVNLNLLYPDRHKMYKE